MDQEDKEDPDTDKDTKWTEGRLYHLTTNRQSLVMVGDNVIKESHGVMDVGRF